MASMKARGAFLSVGNLCGKIFYQAKLLKLFKEHNSIIGIDMNLGTLKIIDLKDNKSRLYVITGNSPSA